MSLGTSEKDRTDPKTIPPYEKQAELEATGPGGFAFKARNLRKLDYMFTLLGAGFLFIFFQHMEDSKKLAERQISASMEVAAAIRFFACIQAVGVDQRGTEARDPNSLCARIGKVQ